jgi:hypothetical protein
VLRRLPGFLHSPAIDGLLSWQSAARNQQDNMKHHLYMFSGFILAIPAGFPYPVI